MTWITVPGGALVAAICLVSTAVRAQEQASAPNTAQISTHMGEMTMSVEAAADMPREVRDALRFEPYQALMDIFARELPA